MDWTLAKFSETGICPTDEATVVLLKEFWSSKPSKEATVAITDLVSVFGKSRKLVEFHRNLFAAADQLRKINGFFDLKLNKKLAVEYGRRILDLSHGQIFQIWELFLSQKFQENTLVISLFTVFLSHIKVIEEFVPEQFVVALRKCLKDTSSSLKQHFEAHATDVDEYFLQLVYAFGNLRCLQIIYGSGNTVALSEKSPWWDISILHEYHSDWKDFFENAFATFSTTKKKCVIKLLTQKIEFIEILALSSNCEDERILRKSKELIVRKLLQYIEEDSELLRSAELELILPFIKKDKLAGITDLIVKEGVDGELITSTPRETFLNNRRLHSAFITSAIAEFSSTFPTLSSLGDLSSDPSVWIDSDKLLPKSDCGAWTKIRGTVANISKINKKLAVSTEQEEKLTSICAILETCVPLGCLNPANQVRILLGWSAILFSSKLSAHSEQLVLKEMVTVFDGERSLWLFDFYKPELFLANLLQCFDTSASFSPSKSSVHYLLISCVCDRIFGGRKAVPAFEIAEILESSHANALLLLTFEVLFLREMLKRESSKGGANEEKDKSSIASLCRSILKRLSKQLESGLDSNEAHLLIEGFVLVLKSNAVEAVGLKEKKVLRMTSKLLNHCLNRENIALEENSPEALLIAAICSKRDAFSNVCNAEFLDSVWQCLFSDSVSIFQDVLISESSDEKEIASKIKRVKKAVKKLRESEEEEAKNEAERNDATEARAAPLDVASIGDDYRLPSLSLLQEYVQCLTLKELEPLTNHLLTLLRSPADGMDRRKAILAWKGVFLNELSCEQKKQFLRDRVVGSLCVELIQVANETCSLYKANEQSCIQTITDILDLARLIMKKGKACLAPQKTVLLLNICIVQYPLMEEAKSSPCHFMQVFQGVLQVLSEAVMHNKTVICATMANYSFVLNRMLELLMAASSKEFLEGQSKTSVDQMEACANQLDMLVALLCSLQSDFHKCAPHLIAVYVNCTQKSTVHHAVKSVLRTTMYKVLKVIDVAGGGESSLEAIHCRLNQPGREVLKDLRGNYNKYYRFKGYV